MPLKTTVMIKRRFTVTLFSFGFQILFHPDEMFHHLLLESALGFRDTILKIWNDGGIRRFLDKFGFQVMFFCVYRLPEIFCRLDGRFLLGIQFLYGFIAIYSNWRCMPALVWVPLEPLCCHSLLHVDAIFVPRILNQRLTTHSIDLFDILIH